MPNGSRIGYVNGISADNHTVTLTAGTLPASSTIQVVATSGVQDMSGNALANFQSQFTTAAAFDTTNPSVVSQRPGSGAQGVPLNTPVVLYLSEPINASTVSGALHISQNGVLVNGTTQVTGNAQVVQFTPATPFQNNALVQVFLDSTAKDVDGQSVTTYQGSFTTAADTSSIAPSVVSTNPTNGSNPVPTNLLIDVGFNEPLNPATVNGTNVILFDSSSNSVASAVSLVGNGTIVQIVPNAQLGANATYYVQITNSLQGTNGLSFPGAQNVLYFTTGAVADTTPPTVVSVSPPNGSANVGDNAGVRVVFNKAINPLTANGSTIRLMPKGGAAIIPSSVTFSNNNQSVLMVPQAPLPDSTPMTITISGVTDVAGNAVATQTTQFTTGTGPDVTAPIAIAENPPYGATNVPINAPLQLQVNEPIDPGTVNSTTLPIYDSTTGQSVAGSYSVNPSGQTISFLPSAPLAVSRNYYGYFNFGGITDLSGNPLTCSSSFCNISFTTGTASNTIGPQIVGVSPVTGLAGVPINAQVVIQLGEPVDALTPQQITLSAGGGAVNAVQQLSNANQTLTVTPLLLLASNTTYTVTITGVQDLSGNALTNPTTTTFTTGAGVDLTPPQVSAVSPVTGVSGVPTNAVVQLLFKRIDPLTVTNTTFYLYPAATGIPVPATVAVTPDGMTATLTPSAPLVNATSYSVQAYGIQDLVGQILSFSSYFTTQ